MITNKTKDNIKKAQIKSNQINLYFKSGFVDTTVTLAKCYFTDWYYKTQKNINKDNKNIDINGMITYIQNEVLYLYDNFRLMAVYSM